MSKFHLFSKEEIAAISPYGIREIFVGLITKVHLQEADISKWPLAFQRMHGLWTEGRAIKEEEIITCLSMAHQYFQGMGIAAPTLAPKKEEWFFKDYLVRNLRHPLMLNFMKRLTVYFARVAMLQDKQGESDKRLIQNLLSLFPPRTSQELLCFPGTSQRLDMMLTAISVNGCAGAAVEWLEKFSSAQGKQLIPLYMTVGNEVHFRAGMKSILHLQKEKDITAIDSYFGGAISSLPLSKVVEMRAEFMKGFRLFLMQHLEETKQNASAFILRLEAIRDQIEERIEALEQWQERVTDDPSEENLAKLHEAKEAFLKVREAQEQLDIEFWSAYGFRYADAINKSTGRFDITLFMEKAYSYLDPELIAPKRDVVSYSYQELYHRDTPAMIAKQLTSHQPDKIEEGLMALRYLCSDFKGRSPMQLFRTLQALTEKNTVEAGIAWLKEYWSLPHLTQLQKELVVMIAARAEEMLLSTQPSKQPCKRAAAYVNGKKKVQLLDLLLSGAALHELRAEFAKLSKAGKRYFYDSLELLTMQEDNSSHSLEAAIQLVFRPDALAVLSVLEISPSRTPAFLEQLFFLATHYRLMPILKSLVKAFPYLSFSRHYNANNDEISPAYHAVKRGDLECLQLFFEHLAPEEKQEILNEPGPRNQRLLSYAFTHNQLEVFKWLGAQGANIHQCYNNGDTLLHMAVRRQNNVFVRAMVEMGADSLEANHWGETACSLALLQENNEELILALMLMEKREKERISPLTDIAKKLWRWADENQHPLYLETIFRHVSTEDKRHLLEEIGLKDGTSMEQLAAKGVISLCRYRLKHGENINAANEKGETPLYRAIAAEQDQMALWLIAHGANVNAATKENVTPLHLAVRKKQTALINALIDKGANMHAREALTGRSPLEEALFSKQFDIAYQCLKRGANHEECGDQKSELWQYLIRAGEYEGVKQVFEAASTKERGALLQEAAEAFYIACAKGDTPTVLYLLEQGIAVNSATNAGKTPLYAVMMQGDTEIAGALIKHGAHINATHPAMESPLYTAASVGNVELVSELCKRGAYLNTINNNNGKTAIAIAAEKGRFEVVRTLLHYGADRSLLSPNMTEMIWMWAVRGGHTDCLKTLIATSKPQERKRLLTVTDASGFSSLSLAAYFNRLETVQYLLEESRKLPAYHYKESTALYYAAARNHLPVVELLVSKGAKMEAHEITKKTALDVAAEFGHAALIPALAKGKIDINKPTRRGGKTPVQLAACGGHLETVLALLKEGANIEDLKHGGKKRILHEGKEAGKNLLDQLKQFENAARNLIQSAVETKGQTVFPQLSMVTLSHHARSHKLEKAVSALQKQLIITFRMDVDAMNQQLEALTPRYVAQLQEAIGASKSRQLGKMTIQPEKFTGLVKRQIQPPTVSM